jgi:hypothetical protein
MIAIAGDRDHHHRIQVTGEGAEADVEVVTLGEVIAVVLHLLPSCQHEEEVDMNPITASRQVLYIFTGKINRH